MNKVKLILFKTFKVFLKILIGLVMLVFVLFLFVRSPWGQDFIVQKVVSYVSGKTNSKIDINRLYFTFSGNLYLEGLYMEDAKGDTLVYSKKLETGVKLMPLIRNGGIHISKIQWTGLKAHILRGEEGRFNFDFLMEAFVDPAASDSTTFKTAPEEESSYPEIAIGPVELQGFDLSYEDEVSGIKSSLSLGKLEVRIEKLDLENMGFYIKDFQFRDSEAFYQQTKVFPPSDEDTTESVLPLVIIDNFQIERVNAVYESLPDEINAAVELGELLVQLPEADLAGQKIDLRKLVLSQSKVKLKLPASPPNRSDTQEEVPIGEFEWPAWTVDIGSIDFSNNEISYAVGQQKLKQGEFDPEAVDLDKLNFKASQIYLNQSGLGLSLDQFDFHENSGFGLKEFTFQVEMNQRELKVQELQLATLNSKISGGLGLSYASIKELISQPEKSGFSLDFSDISLAVNEAYPFVPELKQDFYIMALAEQDIKGVIKSSGTLDKIEISQFDFGWGEDTKFKAKGSILNPLEEESFAVDFNELNFSTIRNDIKKFVHEEDYGVKFPKTVEFKSEVKGGVSEIFAEANLMMPEGDIDLSGSYKDEGMLVYDLDLHVQKVLLGELLPGMGLDTLSFSLSSSGQGNSLESISANFQSDFDQLGFNGYNYSGLSLQGELIDGHGGLNLSVLDEYVDLDLDLELDLDSVKGHYGAVLDLRGVNLMALGFSQKDIRTKMRIEVDFNGNPDSFDLKASVAEGLVVYDEKNYPLGDFKLDALVRPDSTSMDINSLMLNGYARSNSSPEQIITGIQNHFQGYLRDSLMTDSLRGDSLNLRDKGVILDADLIFNSSPVLDQVVLQGLDQMDSLTIQLDFNEQEEKLLAQIDLPRMDYNDLVIDSLSIEANGDGQHMAFGLGVRSIKASPLSIGKTNLKGELENKLLRLNFVSFDGDEELYYMDSELKAIGDTMGFHVIPDKLILNRKNWEVPESNQVLLSGKSVVFKDFSFSNNLQQIRFSNELNNIEESQIGLSFNNFRLATLVSLLNPDEQLMGGKVNGDFIVENPFGAIGLLADLKIDELMAMGTNLGNLKLEASSKNAGNYDFKLALKDRGIDLDLIGGYIANETGADLDLNLSLNELKLEVLQNLMDEEISEATGSLKGGVVVSGNTASPQYDGDFSFDKAALNVNSLNSKFSLPEQVLRVDQDGVYFDNYTFKDAEGNDFSLDGEINTSDMTNMVFDLNLKANNFQLLDSDRENNELFYGKANVDADVRISGDMNLPIIKADLKVNEGTSLTFVIPETELDVVEREGVVLIVDRDDPNDILTKTEGERMGSLYTGMELEAIFKVDPDAEFQVIVDERSGDNLLIAGRADINFAIEQNGRMNMTGVYELEKGHYEMSLYSLVSRKFNIVKGSTITWKGNPMDADLDITASYEVRTSSSELMASQISGVSTDVANQYRERLDFLVYLNVEGELLRPEIFFGLDMPEDEQGAMGGNVYEALQQVNEDEGELNRQVFSLLVFKKFMPNTGGDGSGGMTTGLARSSVSQMLSSQLNSLSNNVLGNSGFELDFDLDSYSGYEGNRTQLSVNARKRLFDDRLIVQVGSQMDLEGTSQSSQNGNTAMFGNVNLEYLLTENGRYRVRGFRKNEYESVIDGQLIVTGIAFILNREFNKFYEFWKGEKDMSQLESSEKSNKEANVTIFSEKDE
ncbi:translocation/assembly module TamB domain-containing protein [Echinicola salinicaeni]|uniref:translocation/assembly module TamB domain-containing protein n=1 Tax=Echinicola salinicaeni TaxID=2762757 RepID=UPI0016456AFD|nr:translocation/assembly module TamB [Echinicola salinicaeni]